MTKRQPRHPDFEPGNTYAEVHGARSERRWRPIADALAAELLAEKPWLQGHARSVLAWARVESQVQLISNWLDTVGLLDGDGIPRAASTRLDRLEVTAARLRAELAEGPLQMAKLLDTLASTASAVGAAGTLESLKLEGRRFVAAYLDASPATEDRELPA